MAPFGGKFLKARLKSRSEGKDDAEPGKEIPVWVQQEEKTVCGLTRHTTCADVVQALLEDQGASGEAKGVPPTEYCLVERWKGFERALPPLTRILRLWTAWGDERAYVQFVLVRSRDHAPRLGDSKTASKASDQAPAQYVRSLPVERQKRMVRKAFRKLEKIRERERPPGLEDGRIGSLVQLIISQDRAIREQTDRMRELDLEIERVELGLGAAPEPLCLPPGSAGSAGGLGHLEQQLERHRELVERLSRDIDAELSIAWRAGGGGEELQGAAVAAAARDGPEPGPDVSPQDAAEVERVRRDLEHSMYRGLTLQAQLAELERELELSQAVLGSKAEECEGLAAELSVLVTGPTADSGSPCWTEASGLQPELRKVLSCSGGDGTDTDSDTGISSTHSQDSLSPWGDVRPALETQV